MAAASHGIVVGKMHMYEVVCVLCTVKLEDKASRINVRGRSSFPIETELRKLSLKLSIDDNTRLCFPCLRKLKKKKSVEENFAAASEEIEEIGANIDRWTYHLYFFSSTHAFAASANTPTKTRH